MPAPDPRKFAEKQFAACEPCERSVDLVASYATDVELVVDGLLEATAPRADAWRFCEIAFGSGWLMTEYALRFPAAALFGIDLSEEFAERAHKNLPGAYIVRGDMEALPFRDRAFDCVASCCALYFARDIERALCELKRVSARRVVINTVAPDNMRELDAFSRRVLPETTLEDIATRFDMATAEAQVSALFPTVCKVEWRGTMRLPAAEDLVKFWSGFHHQDIAVQGPALLERARRAATEFTSADGSVSITRGSGAFIVDL